jgi:3-dehydroquinate dehydratase
LENSADAYREDIQDMLSAAINEEFPDLNLNQAEIEELTDVVITIRESMEDLRSMVRSSDTVEAIKELQQQRDLAMLDFERITGVSVMEFMLHAPGEGGIDRD